MSRKRKSDEPYKRPGSNIWQVRIGGRRVSSGTTNYDDAAEFQRQKNSQLYRQQELGASKPVPWCELVQQWFREKAHKPSLYKDRAKLEWFEPHLGNIDSSKITRQFIDKIICDNRPVTPGQPSKTNTTANTYVNVVQWILNAAAHEWDMLPKAPKLRRYPEAKTEKEWLRVGQWLQLAPHLPRHMYRPALFSLATGVREARCFGLRWEWVDMRKAIYRVPGCGNKRGVEAPLNQTALAVLEECRRQPVVHREWVFLYAGERMTAHGYTTWEGAFRRAGLSYVNWHGLRHTFISWLHEAGVPYEIRQRLVGHKGSDVHSGYTHIDLESLRPWTEKIDVLLQQANSTRPESQESTELAHPRNVIGIK